MPDIDAEEFVVVRSGLNKADLSTVMLQVNGHYFRFSSVKAFKAFALVAMTNASDFEEIAKPKTKAERKAAN